MSWLDTFFQAAATGNQLGGQPVGSMAGVNQGWEPVWDATDQRFEPGRGVVCVESSTVTVTGETPTEVATANFQAGDMVLFCIKTAVSQGSAPVVASFSAGVNFYVVADVNDASTYYYQILRAGTILA